MGTIENLVKELTEEQKQLLKDTINYGSWGGDLVDFVDEDGNLYGHHAYGYCTNDAKNAGHFSGRKISAMFRAIYKKLCCHDGIYGEFLTHYSDWWGDGTGDMLFIKLELVNAFEEWARE